eukprot:4511081-Amphidinium_carterae.2
MSKRKPQAVKTWESVLQSGQPQRQIDAAERLLRSSWVMPLPIASDIPWVETDGRWCAALVLAVTWTSGPGTQVSRVVLAVPDAAREMEEGDQQVLAPLYLPGAGPPTGEPSEEALVNVFIVAGEYLVKRLAEGIPRSESLITFGEVDPAALPIGAQLLNLAAEFEELNQGITVQLEDETEDLIITHGGEGLMEETYHSTGEMDFGELRDALIPVAAAPSAKRRAAAAPKAGGATTGSRKAAKVPGAITDLPDPR